MTCKISAEDESNDSKYTVFNCVKSHYAHFIRNYFSLTSLALWKHHARKFIFTIINLRGVSTKLNKYILYSPCKRTRNLLL